MHIVLCYVEMCTVLEDVLRYLDTFLCNIRTSKPTWINYDAIVLLLMDHKCYKPDFSIFTSMLLCLKNVCFNARKEYVMIIIIKIADWILRILQNKLWEMASGSPFISHARNNVTNIKFILCLQDVITSKEHSFISVLFTAAAAFSSSSLHF
jgi:hypothetical protein